MANILINLNQKNDSVVEQKWTYRDISVPLDDLYSDNRDVNAIRASLVNIFSWRQGERILDPQFGNILHSFIFEQMTNITKENIKKGVVKMIGYEPRVGILNVDVQYKSDIGQVNVQLQYNIPSLNVESISDNFIINR